MDKLDCIKSDAWDSYNRNIWHKMWVRQWKANGKKEQNKNKNKAMVNHGFKNNTISEFFTKNKHVK